MFHRLSPPAYDPSDTRAVVRPVSKLFPRRESAGPGEFAMIPKPPPREGNLGFLYLPPYRVQGFSVAGENTCVMVPELDVCFDAGQCLRASLAAKYMCISHGHMDHIGGLAYWCSQRNFQGMGPGTIVCDKRIEADIRGMMDGFVQL
ncbi:MAG: ribonuclease Z, partial [Phycisphaerales bacterium]